MEQLWQRQKYYRWISASMWHGIFKKYSSAMIKIDVFYIFKRWPKLISIVTQGVSD